MGEVADATNNLTAIVLFWLWWVLLSFLDIATRGHEADAGGQARRLVAGAPTTRDSRDTRFSEIMRFDPGFEASTFLAGARRAYELIVQAFATGDIVTLKPLLSADVLAAFEQAVASRRQEGRSVEFALVAIDRIDITNIAVSAEAMEVTIVFHSQLVWTELSADGSVASGNPAEVLETVETWTFARTIPVTTPVWTLVATGM